MDRIAFIYGNTVFYWSGVIVTLGALSAVLLFLGFSVARGQKGVAAAVAVPLSIALSMVFARLVHWYCRADSYPGFLSAMTDYTSGGYALVGVFAGCALAAVIVRAVKLTENLPGMLDAMSLAGCAGIAVGRLACFYNTQDRGQILWGIQGLPWVYPVVNPVSGVTEYRLATFVLQSMAAAGIFAVLLVIAGVTRWRRKDGDLCLLFLLCYGASQVVLDSTRYDSLFFRSNGFVSVVQVLSALTLALVCGVFSARLVKRHGFRWWYLLMWLLFAALAGCAGFMEYYVQRHGDRAVFAYSSMSGALAGLVATVLLIWHMANKAPVRGLLSDGENH